MTEFADVFTNLAYPVAVTLVLFYYIFTEQKNFRKAIENNTLVMTKLLSYFKGKGDGVENDGD